jgi:hypothetical protein
MPAPYSTLLQVQVHTLPSHYSFPAADDKYTEDTASEKYVRRPSSLQKAADAAGRAFGAQMQQARARRSPALTRVARCVPSIVLLVCTRRTAHHHRHCPS